MSFSIAPIDSINYTVFKDSGRPPRNLIDNDKLAELLLKNYPAAHHIRTDKAL